MKVINFKSGLYNIVYIYINLLTYFMASKAHHYKVHHNGPSYSHSLA